MSQSTAYPSPSRPRMGSEMALAADQQAMLGKLQRNLDELRSRYSAERKELLAAASDHVADARAEMDQTKQLASRCINRVDGFRRQLRSLESAAQAGAAGDVDTKQSLVTGSERLSLSLDNLREASEQTQLLQAAILNDRVRREARMRQARDEDAELELRLRHLEESNAMMRAELAAVKAVNAEAFKSIDRVLEICRPDATSAIHGSELKQIHNAAVKELAESRESLTVLQAKVDSIEHFTKTEDARRNAMLEQLERVVKDIESRPPPPAFTPKISVKGLLPSSADGGYAADGTYPAVAPHYGSAAGPALLHDTSLAPGGGGGAGADSLADARRRAAAQLRNQQQQQQQQQRHQHPNATPPPDTNGSVFAPVSGSPHGALPPLRNRLMAFYAKFNPAKLSEVDKILSEYVGAEEELMSSLEVHYDAYGYFSHDLEVK